MNRIREQERERIYIRERIVTAYLMSKLVSIGERAMNKTMIMLYYIVMSNKEREEKEYSSLALKSFSYVNIICKVISLDKRETGMKNISYL